MFDFHAIGIFFISMLFNKIIEQIQFLENVCGSGMVLYYEYIFYTFLSLEMLFKYYYICS